jgi:hypothetical protein
MRCGRTSGTMWAVLGYAAMSSVTIYRPFSETDSLFASFDVWDEHLPCSDCTAADRPRLVLFGANAETAIVPRLMAKQWANCFSSITAASARIPPELDVYNISQANINPLWNRGPTEHFLAMGRAELSGYVYWMEPDSVPTEPDWLCTLDAAIAARGDFAILGSVYRGHNWDEFKDQMHPALVLHLNGNAVYNMGHATTRGLLKALVVTNNSAFVSSFDVRIAEILIDRGDLGGYIDDPLIANYAGTLTTAPINATFVHGAIAYAPWSVAIDLAVTGNGWYEDSWPYGTVVYGATNICEAGLLATADWFMMTTVDHRRNDMFALPTETSSGLVRGVIPRIASDSAYCGPLCAARVIENYPYDVAELSAVYSAKDVAVHCMRSLIRNTNDYFAGLSNASEHYVFYDRERYGILKTFSTRARRSVECSDTAGSFLCTEKDESYTALALAISGGVCAALLLVWAIHAQTPPAISFLGQR